MVDSSGSMNDPHSIFLRAYETYSDAIFRHCYFRLSNRERALELMQETFMRVWESIANGRQIEQLRAFLYRIANNLIIDEYRRSYKKTASLDALQEEGFEPGKEETSEWNTSLDAHAALKVVDQLSPAHKEVILLRYVDDFAPKEIAKVLGESENVVSVRLHRATKELRSLLKS